MTSSGEAGPVVPGERWKGDVGSANWERRDCGKGEQGAECVCRDGGTH